MSPICLRVCLTTPPGASDSQPFENTTQYLGYLDLATVTTQESLIDEFSREILSLLGFSGRSIVRSTRYITRQKICGETNRTAQTDVCLPHRRTRILLVLAKPVSNKTNVESQVVAEAIAVFRHQHER